jgi:hypothetical protein
MGMTHLDQQGPILGKAVNSSMANVGNGVLPVFDGPANFPNSVGTNLSLLFGQNPEEDMQLKRLWTRPSQGLRFR